MNNWANPQNFVCTLDELKEFVSLNPEEENSLKKVISIHPMKIPRYYLSLINKEDLDDPIKKMIVPCVDELNVSGDYDTSGEEENTKMEGLQYKYPQTAVILLTNQCAAYCRFCFRKRLVGLSTKEILERLEEAVDYIRKHKEIKNVLITGGDAFVISTEIISRLLEKLSEISHLNFIRFGTRIPVTYPDRILDDENLLDVLKKYLQKKRIYVMTHFNHLNEITEKSVEAVNKLTNAGIVVNNQTVLLRGVNDDPDVLVKLMNGLTKIGVNPYYVFQCRPVSRVKHHFQVPLVRGYKIIEETKNQLSGLAKRFRYVMSHKTGKIEILGILDDEIYLKYHQAKNPENAGKFFKKKIKEDAGWLDDLE
ncbi:KamA family radical SAM protein [Nanoarchaeota archaeon]